MGKDEKWPIVGRPHPFIIGSRFVFPPQPVSEMMTNICYTTSMADVKIAYAKAHLAELLARVARGERIVISRYNTPMAEIS